MRKAAALSAAAFVSKGRVFIKFNVQSRGELPCRLR